MADVKEKAKKLARKLRAAQKEKEAEGHVKIDNVEETKKLKPKHVKEDSKEETKPKRTQGAATAVGPKGGVYQVTSSGGRKYGVKKSLEEFLTQEERIQKTIDKVKAENKPSGDKDSI